MEIRCVGKEWIVDHCVGQLELVQCQVIELQAESITTATGDDGSLALKELDWADVSD